MTNASFPRRLGAMLYDGLLVLAVLFAATIPLVALQGGTAIEGGNLIYRGILLGISCLFFAGFWHRYGRTLGMQTWGLRIETETGERPSAARCVGRFFLAILSWLPFGIGFLWQLVDREGLSWHDRLSGTRLRHYPKAKNKTGDG